MNWLLVHGILFPVIAALPLLVTLVVAGVARREAVAGKRAPVFAPRQAAPLLAATAAAWAAILVWFVFDGAAIAGGVRGAWLGGAEIGVFSILFGLFALPLLGKIERAALGSVRESLTPEERRFRSASLAPRRLSDYLPASTHLLPVIPCVVAMAELTARVAAGGPDAWRLLPLGYGAAAILFLLLYEFWLRDEALGAQALPDGTTGEEAEQARRQRVGLIFTLQSLLACFFSAMSLIAGQIGWQSPTDGVLAAAIGAVSGIVGTAGCAFALSSSLQERCLRLVARNASVGAEQP